MTRDDGLSGESGEEDEKADLEEGQDGRLPAAKTRVLDEAETATAETRLIVDEDATELPRSPDSPQDADRTQLVSQDSSVAPTRVLDPSVPPEGFDESGAHEAETVLATELDKTPPPPAGRPALQRPQAAAPPPPAPPAPRAPDRGLAPGMVLFGEYEIVNVLGVGGMGEVYRAKHRRLEEHRAIKVMHAELSKKKGASEFFYREAKALLAVRHPAVVHCHDLLSDDEGRVYLIMEMIEGIPLSKKMDEGPLSADDVAILGARVSHGLSAAHRKGVIHRDLSPDNIVLPNGRVREAKIIDFGIAKILEEGDGTIVDGFKGKLSYASPEQLGFFGGKLDGRSDFYSLGLLLVAAALGRPMDMGTTVMEAVDARRSLQTLPDEIPMGLRSAIQPLLALDPKDRPKYVDRLFVVPGGVDSSTDPSHSSAGAARGDASAGEEVRSRAGLLAAIGALAAIIVGGGLYWALGGSGAQDRANPATPSTATSTTPVGQDPTPPALAGAPEPSTSKTPETKAPETTKPATPRRISASDRIKIIGLISNAKLALEEGRLMSPADDNAYDRYRRVLELDPNDRRAKQGLRDVSARYVRMAERAVGDGQVGQARIFVDRAKRADASHPGIASVEGRISP